MASCFLERTTWTTDWPVRSFDCLNSLLSLFFLLSPSSVDRFAPSSPWLEKKDRPQSITITDSTVFGNVIGGNSGFSNIASDLSQTGDVSASSHDIMSNVGNTQRQRDINWHHDVFMPMKKDLTWNHDVNMPVDWHHDVALDTQWRHDVFMPIGNTKKSVDVSANGTNIRHRVDTDLFDKASHRLGEIASSRLGGRETRETSGTEDSENTGDTGDDGNLEDPLEVEDESENELEANSSYTDSF